VLGPRVSRRTGDCRRTLSTGDLIPRSPALTHRQKDSKDGRYTQVVSNVLDTKMRDDLERLKKIRNHRGLRHYWGVRVRGQHTKTTGRRGRTVGVSKKR